MHCAAAHLFRLEPSNDGGFPRVVEADDNNAVLLAATHLPEELLEEPHGDATKIEMAAVGGDARTRPLGAKFSRAAGLRFISNYVVLGGRVSSSGSQNYLPTHAARAQGRAANYLKGVVEIVPIFRPDFARVEFKTVH